MHNFLLQLILFGSYVGLEPLKLVQRGFLDVDAVSGHPDSILGLKSCQY